MNAQLKKYLPLVDFLAEVLGKNTEAVLLDVEDLDHSIVAIRNGYISGRSVGSPATNVALKLMNEDRYRDCDFFANYRGVSADGRKLRSSTFFLRDDEKNLVGMLCVNIDLRVFDQFRDYINGLIDVPQAPEDTVEQFSSSIEGMVHESIQNAIKELGVPPTHLCQDERIEIVKKLNANGTFLLKGTISQVAARLCVSEATIYRYLNGIKKKSSQGV